MVKSTIKDGRYLIFTTLNGFSDEGCWDGVKVNHLSDSIIWNLEFGIWNLEIGDINYKFSFNKGEYINKIQEISIEVEHLDRTLVLEPKNVIYPFE